DLGAELGQDLGGGRAGLELRQVEHPHSGEAIRRGGGIGHNLAPSICPLPKSNALPQRTPRSRGGRRGFGAFVLCASSASSAVKCAFSLARGTDARTASPEIVRELPLRAVRAVLCGACDRRLCRRGPGGRIAAL